MSVVFKVLFIVLGLSLVAGCDYPNGDAVRENPSFENCNQMFLDIADTHKNIDNRYYLLYIQQCTKPKYEECLAC